MLKRVLILCAFLLIGATLTGCGSAEDSINVTSREDGSGTRGAFSELFEITEKQADGSVEDKTAPDAEITNSTAVVMQTVGEDRNAIGYMSIGSLNDTVKALRIDGVDPTAANVKNGSYKIMRPFILAVGEDRSGLVDDFLKFILSAEGQSVTEEEDYIAAEADPKPYEPTSLSGKITVAGSSSVSPLMESLIEEYTAINPDITVELQQSDSTTGITTVGEGISDIGMSSRNLEDSETALGLTPIVIAYDGLAVIVNNDNPHDGLSKQEIFEIFTGELTDWSQIKSEE